MHKRVQIRLLAVLFSLCVTLVFAVSTGNAITIVGEFIGDGISFDPAGIDVGVDDAPMGGPAAPVVTGGGSITAIFDAAASWWEQAILDTHTVTIQYGWGPRPGSALATAFPLSDTPQPPVYGKILVDNDGSSSFFADATPVDNAEYSGPVLSEMDFGAGLVNSGRVYSGGPAEFDLLTIMKHEIGHILSYNTLLPDWGTITPPRPFAGSVLPKADPFHIAVGTALMSDSLASGERKALSAIDILGAAEHGSWSDLDLDPVYDPMFFSPSQAVADIAVVGVEGGWGVPLASFEGFAHHGLPTLLLEEDATDDAFFDLEIEVTMDDPEGMAFFALDKVVTNLSGEDWPSFEMVLGTSGPGGEFIPSGPDDGLQFAVDPPPDEEFGVFFGEPIFDDIDDPNVLFFDAGTHLDGDTAAYWLGLFADDMIDGVLDGKAVFRLRQVVTIPEPSSAMSMMLAIGMLRLWRRKSTKH